MQERSPETTTASDPSSLRDGDQKSVLPMQRNPGLYARILRLTFLRDPCRAANSDDLNDIVREVIVPDRSLVWC